ncbi:hypothetical protein N866_07210 [Actinotalea ferrariae CF5-4]|uniref:Gp28/Gp37-like domain-containing protein n=1 Tax=Actinotalea ferrariae CF5-4 TaxID=948458 RepID=A0A021VXC8_9CELL|nr:hypothetical protein N866_07210 [Actinotalea ferrariae CF5-4]
MDNVEPFDVQLFDKDLSPIGWVGDPELLNVTPRHNQQPSARLTVPADHRYARALAAPGTRAVVRHQDEHATSGPVRLVRSTGAGDTRMMTFEITDDWRLLTRLLGWPNPTGSITQQGDDGAYDVRSGAAETVLKAFLTANLARLGAGTHHLPVTIAPDQGRGASIDVQMRMHPLADRVLPAIDQAGIGVTVRQGPTGLVVDCYEPTQWPLNLSEDGGSLIASDWSLAAPEVTRVIVMADGEGEARVMRGPFVNTDAETAYRDVIERAIDARDLKSTELDFETRVAARAAEALAAGAAKAGLAVRLAETDTFRYGGDGVHVGDRVTVELAPATDDAAALLHTDVLREATLTWGRDGAVVTPTVGDRDGDTERIFTRALAVLARRYRDLAGD